MKKATLWVTTTESRPDRGASMLTQRAQSRIHDLLWAQPYFGATSLRFEWRQSLVLSLYPWAGTYTLSQSYRTDSIDL